ncbi:MAG: indole-3-glycerol phosphate synthase TrpC [Chitinophagaceae bacterium]|nr:indole-3-glycerol phosphate synthase TrpC [Chitinophagaceae bacterium]
MNNILEQIVKEKEKEVRHLTDKRLREMQENQTLYFDAPCRSLSDVLREENSLGIIAEFKRKSPSKGWMKPAELTPDEIVRCYSEYAAAISVLTDEPFFGGSLRDLQRARELTRTPLLRKDFIIDERQIIEAKAFGADIVLLIAAILTPKQVRDFAKLAAELGMQTLLEIHEEEELEHFCDEVTFVGINNRNLKTFEVNPEHSIRLFKKLPPGKPVIAESGIHDTDTLLRLKACGFSGFLIGERFMKADNPAVAFREFIQTLMNNQQMKLKN